MTDLTRRRFLAGTGALWAAGALAPVLSPRLAFAADGTADHTLVLVVLQGGLDGISALVPAADPAYPRSRRATRVDPARALAVDDHFGLHPSMSPLAELWSDGLVAAVPAVGTATQTRSHFAEQAMVASGTGGGSGDDRGWLARHLLTRPGRAPAILDGIACGAQPAMALRGHPGAFHLPDLATAGLSGWPAERRARAEAALADAYASADPRLAGPAASAFEALATLRSSGVAQIEAGAAYGDDACAQQLRQVAQLMRSDIGMEAAVVSATGWDTHHAQGSTDGTLARLLEQISRALSAFMADISDRLEQTTVVVVSEFGRRVEENLSGGTDHGRGGLMLVLGRGINGGVHGQWPGMDADSLQQGDIAVTTDVRSVFAEVVSRRLGNPALDQVFPGFAPTPVGVV